MQDFNALFNKIAALKVAVIGDVMLDTYWWGHVERISPEAPVPVVALNAKDHRVGGAANVALNCVAFKCATSVFSVIGNDLEGDQLVSLLTQGNISTSGIIKSANRITTNKTRVMSRNQQMMRLDSELTVCISKEEEDLLLQKFEEYITVEKPSVVILEDYNKGVLSERIITTVIDLCNRHEVITTVDPKLKNFFCYKNSTIFKPNLKEIKDALNIQVEVTKEALNEVHQQLFERLNHSISLITLSEHGIYFGRQNESEIIPTHVRSIADVSGAGDTVIAVASLVYAHTNDIKLASKIANIAGGLVCEQVGTVSIDRDNLLAECTTLIKD